MIGAALGAAADGRGGAVKGAAIGAGIGAMACVFTNIYSERTKTAAEVREEYLRANQNLPPEPRITTYVVEVQSPVVPRGQPIRIASRLELVDGSNQPVREVREELVVFDLDGKEFKRGSKSFIAQEAGQYKNSFEVRLPPEARQGVYSLRTNVLVNGKLAESRDLRTRLVWDGSRGFLVASR